MSTVVQQLLQPLQPSQQTGGAVATAAAVAAAPAGAVAAGTDGLLGLRVAAGRGVIKHEKNSDDGEESPLKGFDEGWQAVGGDVVKQHQQQHVGQQFGPRRRVSETNQQPYTVVSNHGSSNSTSTALGFLGGSSGDGSGRSSGDGSSVGSNSGLSSSTNGSTGRADHDEVHAPLLAFRKGERQSSESKLLRPERVGLCRKVGMLVSSLNWRAFGRRYAALTTRGVLILSTYTSASVVAARSGTNMIAGHQVSWVLAVLRQGPLSICINRSCCYMREIWFEGLGP